ncbi:MAG: DUF2061 domain-containing protein [Haliea sp.]|jgi:uncharacterized membrane protein|nr:DUF2061 domain-containing protein [Haliea sp.]MAL95004.1 DUF2061 domain-containing protein [Haliea sp.]|tara:strand:+ start:722 stop:943 length:222 start_codon:yes stop_codon:yes gene_type:complete
MSKTLSFTAMHFTIAFSVAWLLTGSAWLGGLVALVEPAVNSVAYYWHEKLWRQLESRRHPTGGHPAMTGGLAA